jgi:anti-anti-sigma factor
MTGLVTAIPAQGHAEAIIVRLSGEFDLANINQLQDAASIALRQGNTRLVLDLRTTTFLDSTMLNALLEIRHRAERTGGAVVIVRPQPRAWRIFQLAGVDRIFHSAATVEEALATLPPETHAADR